MNTVVKVYVLALVKSSGGTGLQIFCSVATRLTNMLSYRRETRSGRREFEYI